MWSYEITLKCQKFETRFHQPVKLASSELQNSVRRVKDTCEYVALYTNILTKSVELSA
jgi:hypothetical protein